MTSTTSTAADRFQSGIKKLESGQARDAVEDLLAATRIDDGNAKYLAQLSRALTMVGQVERAVEVARQALSLKTKDALSLDTIGVVFSHAGQHELAAQTFRHAVKTNRGNASFLSNLGNSLKFTGDLSGARAAFEAALKIDPRLHKVRFALANVERHSKTSNHLEELEKHFQNFAGDIEDRMYLGYALAKELDDCADYARAFAVLETVNSAWKTHCGYQPDTDSALFTALTSAFSGKSNGKHGIPATQPLFVVGLPRSGTTLTERIVSSHSDVYAAGELTHIPRLTRLMSGYKGPSSLDLQTIRAMPSINAAELGRHYLEAVLRDSGDHPHFVDKWPHNFLYAGLILKALPESKMICVRRNPMDSCLSNFRQLFALGNPFYNYSYDLLDCGRYYLMFDRLMQHWEELFPGRIHTVHYEQLVKEQEAQSRALINYCGLEWQEDCLSFEKNTAPVATASSAQVREPIYTSALARWKNYASELEPLAELFAANNIDID